MGLLHILSEDKENLGIFRLWSCAFFYLLLNMISDIYLRTGVFFKFIKTVLFEEGKSALFAITAVMQVHVNQVTHSLRHHYLPHSFTHSVGEYCSILRTDIWERLKSTYCSLLVDFVLKYCAWCQLLSNSTA